jgi:phage terminase large subunit-like protein
MGLRGPGAKPVKKATEAANSGRKRRPAWQRKGLSRAERVIAFVQSLTLTAGVHAGKKFRLREWQKSDIRSIYRERRGRRIVRTALSTMARKNGKTQLVAALALCHLAGPEAEARGEVYSAASDRNQAARIFRELEAFILADADLSARCNVQRFAKKIEVLDGDGAGSIYEALSSDARKAHSLSPSFLACDELAQWPQRELYDNLVTGTGARAEPLVIVISTQSSDPHHVMSELVDYGQKVIDGVLDDPTFAAFIYTTPDDADIWDEENWYAANPALGDFRSLDEMRQFAERAKHVPNLESVFRNLYLNQAVDADVRFLAAADWDACGGVVEPETLRGRPCWGGLDLSSTTDLTALVLYFPDDGGAVIPFFWVPGDRLAERETRDGVPYRTWREAGLIEAPPGRAIDKLSIARRLAQIAAAYDVQGIAYDRWRIEDLQKCLADEGIELPLVGWGQGFKDMGPAVDAVETATLDRKLRHGGHPVLAWNVSNAVVQLDPAGARKIAKDRSVERVDGLVALAMAIGLHARQPAPPQYDFSRPLVLSA